MVTMKLTIMQIACQLFRIIGQVIGSLINSIELRFNKGQCVCMMSVAHGLHQVWPKSTAILKSKWRCIFPMLHSRQQRAEMGDEKKRGTNAYEQKTANACAVHFSD